MNLAVFGQKIYPECFIETPEYRWPQTQGETFNHKWELNQEFVHDMQLV